MKAKIIKIQEKASRYGKYFYYIFFKDESGKSSRTCIYPQYRNYARWQGIIERFFKSEGEVWVEGLNLKGERLVDADSLVGII